jgi:hypothetical protein
MHWLHSACEKPSIANWASKVHGTYVQYHVFLDGPLPETEAYSLRMVISPTGRDDFDGYEPTDELKTSTTHPDVVARVWRWMR